MSNTTKKTKLDTVKQVSKQNAEVGGLSLAFVLSKVLEAYGVPLSGEELLLIGGLFTGAGARVKDFFKD